MAAELREVDATVPGVRGRPRREGLLLHLHPRAVPAEALRFSRTLGLGGAALVLYLLAVATGLLLLAAYDPSAERAHLAVRVLVREVPFGAFVRSAHAWAADGALAVTLLHLLRVFFRGGHLPPRHANWLLGLVLLFLVIASAYTGRLLPWDQLSFWSVTISSGMLKYVPLLGPPLLRLARGGAEVGPRTLSLFFGLHVAILPFTLFALLPVHFWLVRKAGGVLLPQPGGVAVPVRALTPASPNLLLREGVAALVTIAAVLILAAVADAPLLAQANPGMSPDPAKGPWYLMGLQELLVHLDPAFAAVVIPPLAVGLTVALPFFGRDERHSAAWFHSPRGARLALHAAVAGAALTAAAVLLGELLRRAPARLSLLPRWVGAGVLPVLALAALVGGAGWLARGRGASRLEVVQAVFAFAAVVVLVLTAVGVFLRGPGMALTWPWKVP